MAGQGRPTDYKPEYDEQARKLCLLGYTDVQLADFFGVSEQTLNNWKHAHPSFLESLKKGKEFADCDVVESLYNRAKGYSRTVTEEKQIGDSTVSVDSEKYFPPDPTSMIFWLKNRQRGRWSDRKESSIELENAAELFKSLSNKLPV